MFIRSFTPSGSTHTVNEDTVHRIISSGIFSPEIHRLNSPDYLSAIDEWNQKYLSGDLTIDRVSVLYERFGENDHYSGKNSNSGFSADIGFEKYENRHLRVANSFTVPEAYNFAKLVSFEAIFSSPKNNDGSNALVVSLHKDFKGKPTKTIETFLVHLEPGENHVSVDFTRNITVLQGQKYWLVATAVDLQSSLGWAWNGVDEFLTNNGPVLAHDSQNNSWTDKSELGQQAFRIKAEKYSEYSNF